MLYIIILRYVLLRDCDCIRNILYIFKAAQDIIMKSSIKWRCFFIIISI